MEVAVHWQSYGAGAACCASCLRGSFSNHRPAPAASEAGVNAGVVEHALLSGGPALQGLQTLVAVLSPRRSVRSTPDRQQGLRDLNGQQAQRQAALNACAFSSLACAQV